ncbi:MAG: hypothetical protein ABSD75_24465 [Terriglobales bacterium]|jgi:hypothetical protein
MKKPKIFLTTAALLVSTSIMAQQKPQPQPAYSFQPLLAGAPTGEYSLDPDAVIDATAINDAGEVAFIAHWTDGSEQRAAVFTLKHLVASEGELVGGKTITGISPAALAINNAGQVAYEATYAEPSGSQTGVFVEKRFILALNSAGTPSDFVFTNDGRVLPKAGIAVPAPPPLVQAQSLPSAPPAPPPAKADSNLHPTLSPKVRSIFNKYSPVQIPSNNASRPQATPPPPPPAIQHPAETKPPAPLPTAPPIRTCGPPAFPMPPEWQLGDEPGGVIASHIIEAPGKTRPYDSPFYGRINSPIRVTQFSLDCRPLLIEISDSATRGRIEIWSPAGLVTYLQPSGFFAFNGLRQRVPPGSFVRAETTIRVNARGQLAIPVSLSPHGSAILIGTPISR